MAGTSITNVNDLYRTMNSYYKDLQDWKQKSADALALVKEYERQKAYHESNGSTNDAENVSVLLNVAYGKNSEAINNVLKFTELYNSTKKEWETANDMLSGADKAQLSEQQAAETKLIEANASAEKAKSEANANQLLIDKENAAFSQTQSKFFLLGGVVLFVGFCVFAYFKWIKKVTPTGV